MRDDVGDTVKGMREPSKRCHTSESCTRTELVIVVKRDIRGKRSNRHLGEEQIQC